MYIKVGKDRHTNENVSKILLNRRTIPYGHVKKNGFQKKYPYLKDDYRIMIKNS